LGRVSRSFWDIETSKQTGSDDYELGKTSTEMKDISTYLDSLWDFTNTWAIDPEINSGYPYLQSTILSIESEQPDVSAAVSIYPNPANEYVTISIRDVSAQIYNIQIVNMLDK
jgi:hypothetical protein